MSSTAALPNPTLGLTVSATNPIQSFLLSASKDPKLPGDLQDLTSALSSQSNILYKSLRSIWVHLSRSIQPDLIILFSGCDFSFSSRKPRVKCEELKVRLRKLEGLAERNAYEEFVKDITPKKNVNEPFSSYKNHFSFDHFEY